MKTPRLISIVIPIYNEEGTLPELYERLLKMLKIVQYDIEIIFVNDGSEDRSRKIISEIYLKDKKQVKSINFSRNFGHQAALTAGMDFAQGECMITMDGDLQHPPELIPQLIKEWEEGYEVVYTIREETEKEPLFKKITSYLFYKIFRVFSDVDIKPYTADFRLLDRKVITSLKQMQERARFIRGMVSWVGYKQKCVKYVADSRYAGTSKYNYIRMLSFALKGIISFSTIPLRISFLLGLVVTSLSFIYAVYALIINLVFHEAVEGWTSLLLVILILGGIQLITLGILGEYIAMNFEEAKKRPIYIVTDTLGIEEKNYGQ